MVGRKTWASDDILTAADIMGYLMDQAVTIWANSSARASGILSPVEGMLSYLQDTNLYYRYDGSAWVELAVSSATNANTVNGYKVFSTAGTATPPTASAVGDVWFASA